MDMKEEMMNDVMDDAMGDEDDEEESEAVVNKALVKLYMQFLRLDRCVIEQIRLLNFL